MMPVANAVWPVPLKAVCVLEEVADSCVTDLRCLRATQKRLSGVCGSVWQLRALGQRHARCAWNSVRSEKLSSAEHLPLQCQECS